MSLPIRLRHKAACISLCPSFSWPGCSPSPRSGSSTTLLRPTIRRTAASSSPQPATRANRPPSWSPSHNPPSLPVIQRGGTINDASRCLNQTPGARVLVVELGELGLEARGDRDGAARRCAAACSATAGGHLVVALVDVGDEQHRLGRQRAAGCAARRARPSGTGTVRAGRPACSASMTSRSHASSATAPLVAAAGLLGRRARGGARPARGRRRAARSRSSRCRARGSTRPSGWMTFVVVVRAHDVDDRVGLADVGQELVAQALALVRAAHEARRCRGSRSCRRRRSRRRSSPRRARGARRDRHDGDVRLDRRERVVGRLGARARQRVEQRGLARVGHARRSRPSSRRAPRWPSPSSAPAGDVGRVVHAEVDARDAPSPRPRRRAARPARRPRVGARGGERRRRVRAGEAEPRRRGHRARAGRRAPAGGGARRALMRRVERVGRAPTDDAAAPPAGAPRAVDQRAGGPDREPQRGVLAQAREARARGRSPAAAPRSARRRTGAGRRRAAALTAAAPGRARRSRAPRARGCRRRRRRPGGRA